MDLHPEWSEGRSAFPSQQLIRAADLLLSQGAETRGELVVSQFGRYPARDRAAYLHQLSAAAGDKA